VGTVAVWPFACTRRPFYGVLLIAPIQLLVLVVTAHPLH
jgi:hypothetical protein